MRSAILLAALAGLPLCAQHSYGPDSRRQPGVPEGKLIEKSWTSQVFPGTEREWWIYVPAQYDASTPAAVMIFQDGHSFIRADDGGWMTPIVLDNLIHKGEMPVTVGIFIRPGVLPALGGNHRERYNRSFEYDALGDRYARFLIDEILPEAAKEYNLTSDPSLRAIAGSSSGAICAFTAAWQRPDAFRRVLSFIGSFVNLRGGEIYPSLIRKHEPRPLRVFLQDGRNDLDIYAGSWWIGNQDMAAALEYAGYEYQWVAGDEAHNNVHGRAILPDALRWLWKDWEKPIEANRAPPGDRHFVKMFADPGAGWEVVSEGHQFTEGPAVAPDGDIYFTDVRGSKIWRIAGADGNVALFKDETDRTNGLMFGPDGRLYGCRNGRMQIVAWDVSTGLETILAEGVESNDLAVSANGDVYFTDPANRKVWLLPKGGQPRVVDEGIDRPNGVLFSPDQSLLFVADSWNKWVWSFQIQPDGSLANGQPFYRLETPDASSRSSADGMTVSEDGHLFVATAEGLQICDQPGRVVGILSKPQRGSLSNAVFAGPDMQTLYVTAGDKVFKRRMQVKGVRPWEPVKPPQPRL